MTVIKHAFVNPIPDLVGFLGTKPSDWNADHVDSSGNALAVRTMLTATTNYYVSATGSDSNAGTLASPWLTIQHACDYITANIDFAGQVLNVNIGAGTFVGFSLLGTVGGGVLNFLGAGTGSTTLTDTPGPGPTVNLSQPAATLICVNALNVSGTGNNNSAIFVNTSSIALIIGGYYSAPGTFVSGTLKFSGSPTGYVLVAQQSTVFSSGTFEIAGDGSTTTSAILAIFGGVFSEEASTWTLTGTPRTFTAGFLTLQAGLYVLSTPSTYTGSANGPRYSLSSNSVAGAFYNPGPNYFPGTLPGTTDISSSYGANIFAQPIATFPTTTELNQSGSWSIFQSTQFSALLIGANNAGTIDILGKITLTSDLSLYVSTTGSDSNPGTLASPWATIQHAMDFIASKIDLSGFTITVNIGAGTFAGVGLRSTTGGGTINFVGAGSGSTTITNANNDFITNFGECVAVFTEVSSVVGFDAMKWVPNGHGVVALNDVVDVFAPITLHLFVGSDDMVVDCTNMASGDIVFFFSATGATIFSNAIAFTGGGGTVDYVYLIETGTLYVPNDHTGPTTFSGNLTLNVVFAQVDTGGVVYEGGSGGGYSVTGTVTGKRFNVATNGNISLFGGSPGSLGATYYPGNMAGTVGDGTSIYDGFFGAYSGVGLPTTTQFPDAGTCGIYKDTAGGGVYSVYNDAGTIKKVALV